MSHTVTVKTQIKDADVIDRVCKKLGLPTPEKASGRLYDGKQTNGLKVKLRGWRYPVDIDIESGELNYDNYGGSWGSETELNAFKQGYAVEKAKKEAVAKGYRVSEEQLKDGSVKLTVNQQVYT